ncbi:hypothetical protein NUW58_g4479 [Xylaria curta]|uniref:Uncharacterized protein n=1 Tax=Xylaria curta TaxID=42375 RepID=A0ACC1P671_9PEZI|nr:hypothetical protein NUW58_g4479 [Xylaria curta]
MASMDSDSPHGFHGDESLTEIPPRPTRPVPSTISTSDKTPHPSETISQSPKKPTSHSQDRHIPSITSSTVIYITIRISSGGGNPTNNSNDSLPGNTASPSTSDSGVGNGAVAGIVVGAVVALTIFAGLICLVLYYRHRALANERSPDHNESINSKIDDRFKKAEFDSDGPQVRTTRVYELNTTGEIHEVDGHMKPAELDATASCKLATLDFKCNSVYTSDSEDLITRGRVWDTKAG